MATKLKCGCKRGACGCLGLQQFANCSGCTAFWQERAAASFDEWFAHVQTTEHQAALHIDRTEREGMLF